MKTDYYIVLSSEQLAYLAGSKYGIDRMRYCTDLLKRLCWKKQIMP